MLRRIFKLPQRRSEPSTPDGSRAYAIGDVHGRSDLLAELMEKIERDNAARPPAKTYVVLLGDLVDRGPDSRGVIDYLISNPPSWARPVYIQGNHEEFFLDVLNGRDDVITHWLAYGGYECAESYGVSKGWTLNATAPEIGERLRAQVPQSHRAFLKAMADTFRFGDYLFVHAGIRPGVAVQDQSTKDLRWIREGFLEDETDHGLVVVHGHTIVEKAEQRPNRIGLDTGAYRSGVLTAVGLEGSERWIIDARSGPAAG